jgi:hypothetical protein
VVGDDFPVGIAATIGVFPVRWSIRVFGVQPFGTELSRTQNCPEA